jgi:hypothetical protein
MKAVSTNAAKRAKPKHFEQQGGRARGEKGERQPERLSDQLQSILSYWKPPIAMRAMPC